MTPRSPSPPLIKKIDEIVSRPPNEVNYFALNGKRTETGKHPENETPRKFKKSGNMAKYVKQAGNAGKNGNLREPGNQNKIKLMKTHEESDGEDAGPRTKYKRQKS